MGRIGGLAVVLGAAALLWSTIADAQSTQRQRQPRGTPQPPAARAQPMPAPAPLVRVHSDPAGAACQIVGPAGQTLTRTFGTPEAVPLQSRSGAEQVVCQKPGFNERRAALAPEGQTTSLALVVDPRSRIVTRDTVQPGGGVRIRDVPTADRLVTLREGYLAGKVSERDYFAARRHLIAADGDLPAAPRAAAARPAPRPPRAS